MNEHTPESEPADIFESICLILSDKITELPVGIVPWFQVRLNYHLGTLCTSRVDSPYEVLVVPQETFDCIEAILLRAQGGNLRLVLKPLPVAEGQDHV